MDRKTFWREFKAGHVAVRIANAGELDVFNESVREHGLPESSEGMSYFRYPWRVVYGLGVVGWTGEGTIKDNIVAYLAFAEWMDVVHETNTPTEMSCPDLLAVL